MRSYHQKHCLIKLQHLVCKNYCDFLFQKEMALTTSIKSEETSRWILCIRAKQINILSAHKKCYIRADTFQPTKHTYTTHSD